MKIFTGLIKNLAIASGLIVFMFAFSPQAAGAQENVFKDVCSNAKLRNENPAVCRDAEQRGNPLFGPDGILTKIINIISLLVGIAATIMIIIGGLRFITSGSNPQDAAGARETVLYALVGLVVAAMAQIIVRFILFNIK